MRLFDLLKLSFSNLRRRKTRTLLTILGVVIGTASIVVMVGLGLGMQSSMLSSIQDAVSLTTITVNNYSWMSSESGKSPELTDEAIEKFKNLEHVVGSSPVLDVYVEARSGAYTANYSITGVSQDYLSQIKGKLRVGEIPKPNQSELSLVYGNMIGNSFYKNGDWMNPANLDPETATIFYIFPEGYQSGSDSDAASNEKRSKKYLIKTAGIIEGGPEDYSEYSYSTYADIDTLKTFLRRIYKKNLVPSPRLGKNGKPLRYYVYDSAYVFVDKMENVTDVQKMIADQGFNCNSNMEWIQQSLDNMRITQMVLGGIGAVSLLVAAIGIMNTMMMSIYERTKEIGVMKVLGCEMTDIRNMFLTESAIIGLFGGTLGLLLSYGISFLLNTFGGQISSAVLGGGSGGRISEIPLWLAAFSIVFAVMVGMLSGYLPALRAMKLSPLAALRNE